MVIVYDYNIEKCVHLLGSSVLVVDLKVYPHV